jgi:uncharacterized protein YbbC (DUF1343 family)
MKSFVSLSLALSVFCVNAHALVLLGQERLNEPEYAALLAHKRIGVLAHHASRDHASLHLVDRLAALSKADPSTELKMIFAPEHGYRSLNDELLPDSKDSETGLPVYSLYGPRKAPTAEMFSQIDVMVIDLQDVGLRYYTYPATMVYSLQAAKAAGVKVVVLDRPSPIGAEVVDGVILDKAFANGGLTTLAQIPTRHGMTLGELALYFNRTMNIGADLAVVPMKDWKRTMLWDETGLPWTPPSPALVRSEQSIYYTLFGSLEAVDLAVGRGLNNEMAFTIFGAPWITAVDQAKLVKGLNQINGLKVTAFDWTPSRAIYTGKLCRGFKVELMAMNLPAFQTLVDTLKVMKQTLGTRFSLTEMASMIGGKWVLQAIENNEPTASILARGLTDYAKFMQDRKAALLYSF